MSTTQESKNRPVAPAPAPTRPAPGSREKTGLNNRRLAVMAGLVVAAIVVAAVVLYNIAAPGADEATPNPNVESGDVADQWLSRDLRQFDQGPAWQPNQSALDHQRTRNETAGGVVDGIDPADRKFQGQSNLPSAKSNQTANPGNDFEPMPAPSWQPKWQPDSKVDGFGIEHFDALERGSIAEVLPRSNFASDYDWLVANGYGS